SMAWAGTDRSTDNSCCLLHWELLAFAPLPIFIPPMLRVGQPVRERPQRLQLMLQAFEFLPLLAIHTFALGGPQPFAPALPQRVIERLVTVQHPHAMRADLARQVAKHPP